VLHAACGKAVLREPAFLPTWSRLWNSIITDGWQRSILTTSSAPRLGRVRQRLLTDANGAGKLASGGSLGKFFLPYYDPRLRSRDATIALRMSPQEGGCMSDFGVLVLEISSIGRGFGMTYSK